MLSPNIYWNIFLNIGGGIVFVFLLVAYPLGYFFLARPFGRRFKRIGEGVFEKGIPFFSWGFRVTGFAWNIVLQPYRQKEMRNRLAARFIKGRFKYQERIYGNVNFRKEASPFQIVLAYVLTYGMIFFLLYVYLFLIHDFVFFREFAKARRG